MLIINNISKTYPQSAIKANWRQLASGFGKQPQAHKTVLDNINLTCQQGKVLGLLGPNGAGKTTLMKILASVIQADNGQVLWTQQQLAKNNVGFLSCNAGLYQRLSARENVNYFGKLQGLSRQQIKKNAEQVFELLGINAFADKIVGALSTGMKQKVAIARTLIHDPDVIILDEPTTGLDIMATESLLEMIEFQKQQNKVIIFSTHHLDEVAAIVDNIAVINNGQLCFSGEIDQFRASVANQDLRSAFMQAISAQPIRLTDNNETNTREAN